jgi:hypothetical protein
MLARNNAEGSQLAVNLQLAFSRRAVFIIVAASITTFTVGRHHMPSATFTAVCHRRHLFRKKLLPT